MDFLKKFFFLFPAMGRRNEAFICVHRAFLAR